MGYIYKITNLINGHIYIGKTINSISQRFKEHLYESHQPRASERPLYRAINKYGIENFAIEEIEQIDDLLLSSREQYWINFYNSYYNGYNATPGGDGKPLKFTTEELELIISLYNQKYTITQISQIIKHDIVPIIRELKSLGFDVSNARLSRKPVQQLDKKTNEVLNTYMSINEAEKALGLLSGSHISEVCRGIRKSANGYKWRFIEEEDN